jgi:nucleolar complex protein 2
MMDCMQAVLLRNALTMKSAEAYREVYCWKAINCLEVWGHVLASHSSKELQPLVYPVVQLLLGAARLVPSARWFPIRLRLTRALIALAAATGVYVPVAAVLLEVLSWPGFAKAAYGTGPSPNLLLQLRLSKNNLKLPATQQELVEQVRGLLSFVNVA